MEEEYTNDTEIEDIVVSGFAKKGSDNVFVVNVLWSNGEESKISRKYSDFVSFHRALLRHHHGDVVMLPSFQQLFGKVSSEDGGILIPQITLLTDYCVSLLAQIDGQFVQSFFETSRYDVKLKRRHMVKYASNSSSLPEGFPQHMVLGEYSHGPLAVREGDYVTVFGSDKHDWCYVAFDRRGTLEYGWIPSVYLVEVEGEDDPLINDLTIYFKELRRREAYDLESGRSSLSQASYQSSLLSGRGGRDSVDLLKTGVGFFQYSLDEDCYLICPFSDDDVLLHKRDRVIVVDKDVDGWWFVCTSSGKEGWLPSTILEPRRISMRKGQKDLDRVYYGSGVMSRHMLCYVKRSYRADQTDELSISTGEWVELLYESPSGWWTVRSAQSLGLVPGVYLSKQNDSECETTERDYSIGYNTSLFTEPPPRRETVSRCVSPLSPQALNESPFFDKSLTNSHMYYRRSDRGTRSTSTSPISFFADYETAMSDSEEFSRHNDLWEEPGKVGGAIQSRRFPMSKNPCFDRPLSADVGSSSRKPMPDEFLHFRSEDLRLSLTPDSGTKSPIPDRFLKTTRSEDLRQSPLVSDLERHSPIPDRFFRKSSSMSPVRGATSNVSIKDGHASNPLLLSQSRLEHETSTLSGVDQMHKPSVRNDGNLHYTIASSAATPGMTNSEEDNQTSTHSRQLESKEVSGTFKENQNGGTETNNLWDCVEEHHQSSTEKMRPSSILPKQLSDIKEKSLDLESEEEQPNGKVQRELSVSDNEETTSDLEDIPLPLSVADDERKLTKRYMMFSISGRMDPEEESGMSEEDPVVEQLEPLTTWSKFDLSRRSKSAPPLEYAEHWYRAPIRDETKILDREDCDETSRATRSDRSLLEDSLSTDREYAERSSSVPPPRTSRRHWRKSKKLNLRVKTDKSKTGSKWSTTSTSTAGLGLEGSSSHEKRYEFIPEAETML